MNYNSLSDYIIEAGKANEKWWYDPATGDPLERNVGELLMLCVSELAEAMEGHRKNLKDDKLPQYDMFEVELVDTLIRIFDMAFHLGIPIERIYREKMNYNSTRQDHTNEARLAEGGKKY